MRFRLLLGGVLTCILAISSATTVVAGPRAGLAKTVGPSAPTTALVVSGAWPIPPNGQLHRKIGDTRTGPSPKQVAFSPDGTELWVPLLGAVGVDVYKVPTLERLARIKLGTKGGVEVTFNRSGTRAYVSQMHTATVYEIDRVAKVVLRVIPTGGNWTKVLALSPDEKTLYAANWVSDDISEIDLATAKVRRKIRTVDTPRGLIVSPDGAQLYVAGFENGDLVRIDLATLESTELLRTGGAMRHLVLDERANRLYASDMGTDTVFAIDLSTDKVVPLAKTDSHPNTIDLNPANTYLYVSNRGQNGEDGYYVPGPDWGSVLVVEVATGRAVDAIVGGNQTTGLDVSPDGHFLAFTDFLDGRLQLFEVPPADVLAASDGKRVKSYRAELLKKK